MFTDEALPVEKGRTVMMRQCAWCLRLIDSVGERVSQRPLPKLYEASHGMCCICGARWMEEVMKPLGAQGLSHWEQNEVDGVETTCLNI